MIKTVLVACLSVAAFAAPDADPQVLGLPYAGLHHGVVGIPAAVGAVHHSAVVTNVVETPAEVETSVTPIAATYVAHPGYAGHYGYAGHLGHGYGLGLHGYAGHLIHKREADAEPEADADAYYYGLGYGRGYARLGHYGHGYYGHGYGHGYYGLGYRGYGYGRYGYYGR